MNKDKKEKVISIVGFVCFLICSIYYFYLFGHQNGWNYNKFTTLGYGISYALIAVFIIISKKYILWVIMPIYNIFCTGRALILVKGLLNAYYSIYLILQLIGNIVLLIILICNIIPAIKKKAKEMNRYMWFIPPVAMLIGIIVYELFRYRGAASLYSLYYDIYGSIYISFWWKSYIWKLIRESIVLLCSNIGVLCIGLRIKNIYPLEKADKATKKVIQTTSAKQAENKSGYIQQGNEMYCSMMKHVLLLIFTCGVWYYIWVYRVTGYTNSVEGEEYRDPTKKLLLCLFVPAYGIYWTYKTAQRVEKMAGLKGISSDMITLCLILAIFVPIIPPILLQDKMNNIAMAEDKESESSQKDTAENKKELDSFEELKKFKELFDSGIITQEEFEVKKKEILGL